MGFPDGFFRFGSNFPGMERDFDLSEGCSDFPDGGVACRLRTKNSPMGQKYKEEARLQSFSPGRLRATPGLDMDGVNGGGAGG